MINDLIIKSELSAEPNVYLFTLTVTKDELEGYLKRAFTAKKNSFEFPGFHKGKVPQPLLEKKYGKNYFLNDALEMLVPEATNQLKSSTDFNILAFGDVRFIQADKGSDLIFTVEAVVEPEVILGQYLGLKYKKKDLSVSDDELEAVIMKDLRSRSKKQKADRPSQIGDEVILNYKGFVDGVAFEGGEAADYQLELGSHTFIPGFEEQLVGVSAGEEVKVNVTFPENYHAENLKGKAAVFECSVSEVYEKILPAADDAFAKDQGYESFMAYKEELRNRLKAAKERQAKGEIEDEVLTQAVKNADLHVPAILIANRAREVMSDFEQSIARQGLNLEMYLQYTGQKEEDFNEECRKAAEKQLYNGYVIESIAKKENIMVSDEEVDEEAQSLGERYGMSLEEVKTTLHETGIKAIREDIRNKKAVDLIVNRAIIDND